MKTAMILAAGRGERLKPLTDKIPKALCLIDGCPLIEHHVKNLARSGFERVIVNHAYLGGHIRRHLGNGAQFGVDINYSPEPPGGLETGGGIVHALPLLGGDPFVTVNADIYTDFDFSSLHGVTNPWIHLILVNNDSSLNHFGDFGLFGNQVRNTPAQYTFSGVACYHPDVFESKQLGRYSVSAIIRDAAERSQVTGALHQGIWYDIGSMERLFKANNCQSR